MKTKMMKDWKKYFTVEEAEQARIVMACEKEDEETATGWAEYAVNEALRGTCEYCDEVLKAEAEISKNCRAWNLYGETGMVDVWIRGIAKTSRGYMEFGAYLSDIWQSGAVEYREHMFIQEYRRV